MVCTVCTNCGKGRLQGPEKMGLIDFNFSSIPRPHLPNRTRYLSNLEEP